MLFRIQGCLRVNGVATGDPCNSGVLTRFEYCHSVELVPIHHEI